MRWLLLFVLMGLLPLSGLATYTLSDSSVGQLRTWALLYRLQLNQQLLGQYLLGDNPPVEEEEDDDGVEDEGDDDGALLVPEYLGLNRRDRDDDADLMDAT